MPKEVVRAEAKAKSANFELMRIVAMLMVVMLHALGHGGVLGQYRFGSAGDLFFWLFRAMLYVAVNLFVLLTGYFMVRAPWKPSRIAKLLLQVWFYSILCAILAATVFGCKLKLGQMVYAALPLTGNQYWFASKYCVLLLLSPALNCVIRSMDRRQFGRLVALLVFLFSAVPTVFYWSREWLCSGTDIAWFVVLYFIAAYIRLYGDACSFRGIKPFENRWLGLAGYVALSAGAGLSRPLIGAVGKLLLGAPKEVNLLYSYNTIWMLLSAVCLFVFFKNIQIRSQAATRAINGIGALVFGAYLCSDHRLIRKPLWEAIQLPAQAGRGVPVVFGCVLLVALAIFVAGCAIEWTRLKLCKALGIDRLLGRLDQKCGGGIPGKN